jgi:hypothetical protein
VQYKLPACLLNLEALHQWMGLLHGLVTAPAEVPADTDQSEWPELPIWKAKKWACHILNKLFERYSTHSTPSLIPSLNNQRKTRTDIACLTACEDHNVDV